MSKMAHVVRSENNQDKTKVVWQYILFEWNDSDEELAKANTLAKEFGIRIDWLPTHSAGHSKKYLVDSVELAKLQGNTPSTGGGTAEVRLSNILKTAGIPSDKYLAEVETVSESLIVGVRGTIDIAVRITNLSKCVWEWWGWERMADHASDGRRGGVRLGAVVQDCAGRSLGEIWSGTLPGGRLDCGESVSVRLLAENPFPAGAYRILVDVIDEGVCWFHERGSAPLMCEMRVVAAASSVDTGERHHDHYRPMAASDLSSRREEDIVAGRATDVMLNLGSLFDHLPARASVELDHKRRPPEIVIRVPLD